MRSARRQESVWKVIGGFAKPLLSDRTLPRRPGTTPEAFEALYARRPDPWGVLTSPLAPQRYLALVEAVGRYSPCQSILDVGCGEGAMTRYLVGCASTVVGIDASPTAIARAERLVPKARFSCCTLEEFGTERRFDVVLASEILYYVKEVDVAIKKLLALGRVVIISYTNGERHRLDPHLNAYCPPEHRTLHSFFGLKPFGFTVACLTGSSKA